MIVFAMALSALMLAGMIGVLIWRDIEHARREDRLINLLAARTPHEYAVLRRADQAPVKAEPATPAEPRAPRFPVGL